MSKNEIYGDPTLAHLFEQETKFSKKGTSSNKNVSEEILEQYNSIDYRIPSVGDVITASFHKKVESEYLLSVNGYKDFIRVDDKGSELKYFSNMVEGDQIEVIITSVNNNNFSIRGSVDAIQEKIARDKISNLKKGDFVFGKVVSMNPAGYSVEIKQGSVVLPGFMPNTLAGVNKLYDPSSIVGQEFEVYIESYSESEGTYIVNRKRYLKSLISEEIEKLETGKVYTGRVTGTVPFGIFVEFNDCLTGLIHKVNVNELWKDRLDEIKPGFEIDFYVKEILNKNKIILTQILRESLWDNIEVGMKFSSRVKDVKHFGVLVYLDEETVGLIPSNELKNKDSFKKGDNISVSVSSIDKSSRKIVLAIA